MRICVVLHHFDPESDGVSVSAKRLIENLPSSVEVHVIAGVFTKKRLDVLKTEITSEKTGRIFFHFVPVWHENKGEEFGFGMDNLLFAIKSLHEKFGFDLLHAFFLFPTGFVTTLAARQLNLPVLVSVRGSDLSKGIFVAERFGWIEWTLRSADFVTFLNSDLRDRAKCIAPGLKKSRIILNSVWFPTETIAVKKPGKKIVFGFVGHRLRTKGFVFLIEALAALKKYSFELQVTGEIRSKDDGIFREVILKKGLSNQIRFLGPVRKENVFRRFNACDAVIVPSLHDGCPNVVLEAMFFGRCVVASRIPGIEQLMTDRKEGLLVQPRNSKELSKGIEVLLKNPSLIQKLGKQGKITAKKFSCQAEARDFLRIYRQLIQ